MSRSRRKPYAVDGYGSKTKKIAKRWANKSVRREKNVPNGSSYRKVFNPWNICDWFFYDPDNYKIRRK